MNFEEWIRRLFEWEVRDRLKGILMRILIIIILFILVMRVHSPVFGMTEEYFSGDYSWNMNIMEQVKKKGKMNDIIKNIREYATSSNAENSNQTEKELEHDGKNNLNDDDDEEKNHTDKIITASGSEWEEDLPEETEENLENPENKKTDDQESENLYLNISKNQKNSEQDPKQNLNQNSEKSSEAMNTNAIKDLKDYVLSRGSQKELANFDAFLLDAGGTIIEPDDEGIYHVYDNDGYYLNIHFYAPMGIPEEGIYQYLMPTGMNAVEISSQSICASDGVEIGTLEILESGKVLSINMKENKKIRLNVTFSCTVDFERENPAIKIESHKEGTIAKTGYFNGLTGQFEWTITAQIPGYTGGKAKEWSIRDIMYDLEGNSINWNYDLIKDIYIICDGEKRQLLSETEAQEKELEIAFRWDNMKKPARLYLVNKAKQDKCDNYCTHWYFQKNIVIVINYISTLENSQDWILIDENSSIENHAWLNTTRNIYSIDISPFLSKSHSSDFSKYTITLNPDFYDLSRQSIVIDDVMTGNIYYITGSMTVVVTDKNGISFPLQYGTDFTVEKVEGSSQHIRIHVASPGAYCYEFTYQTAAQNDGGAGEVNNEAKVTLWGTEFCAEDYSFTSSAEEYFVRMKKSEEESGRAVPGALYGIYSSTGEQMAEGITDALGECLFRGDPVNGVLLDRNSLYYLQEIEAPDGYEKNEAKTWFCFEESDYEQFISPLLEEAKFTGVYRMEDGEILKIADGQNETLSSWILVTDQKIKRYTLPQTGGVGTDGYITLAFLIFAGMGSVFHMVSDFSEPSKQKRQDGTKTWPRKEEDE
ncbi:prealbumin-like fold domain-containing protein [Brotaphodocola sp.]|uniref:prealbumin-like fold domain-containing protein n=1 Tax=Brotaphodocola sp. TaxID=3073577 RepID=UPI003D7DEEF4